LMRDICTRLRIPHPIKEEDIIYAEVAGSRLNEEAKIIGGVMRPASIARACWKPLVIAKIRGRSASSA